MIKSFAFAALSIGLLTGLAQAQTPGDLVVSQFMAFKKTNVAAKFCVHEEGRMQIERNDHYDALLRAKAKNPHAPTIDEMSDALAETILEDEALQQKREECEPLLDEVMGAVRELRRECAGYSPSPVTDDEPSAEIVAIDICRAVRGTDTASAK